MIIVRTLVPVLLGACILGALMMTTPSFDDVFKPMRTTAKSGNIGHARLHAARFAGWQTAEQLSFTRYGSTVTRATQGVFLVVDIDILDVQESLRLHTTWQGRSGRLYAQTVRADGAPGTFDVRQFHPGLVDLGRAVFELPRDEIEGGQLLLARKGLNVLDSELALTPTAGAAMQHHTLLRLE